MQATDRAITAERKLEEFKAQQRGISDQVTSLVSQVAELRQQLTSSQNQLSEAKTAKEDAEKLLNQERDSRKEEAQKIEAATTQERAKHKAELDRLRSGDVSGISLQGSEDLTKQLDWYKAELTKSDERLIEAKNQLRTAETNRDQATQDLAKAQEEQRKLLETNLKNGRELEDWQDWWKSYEATPEGLSQNTPQADEVPISNLLAKATAGSLRGDVPGVTHQPTTGAAGGGGPQKPPRQGPKASSWDNRRL